MRLKFIGTDGSMGFRHGREYKVKVWSDYEYIWVTYKEWLFGPKISCPYSGPQRFAENWTKP